LLRSKCLVCHSKNLKMIIDLGNHAFADTFIPPEMISEPIVTHNLSCMICEDCGNIQTTVKTDPSDRYSLFDYSYTSSNSSVSRKHWIDYSDEVASKSGLQIGSFVVEIGSNDGFLLKQFKIRHDCVVLGIDASPHVSSIAAQDGIDTEVSVFDRSFSKYVVESYQKADLVIANNVFNHSEDPLDFTLGVVELLKQDGTFVFELPYWKCAVESEKIDQIYHEHVTYFTVTMTEKLLARAGLVITDVNVVDYHGGSLRVHARKAPAETSDAVERLKEEEKNLNLFEVNTYSRLFKKLQNKKFNFLKKIYELKAAGNSIVAIGAAAKGNTFLNFLNLDKSVIDCVTDASEYKKGKLTPLSSIPIYGDEALREYSNVYAIILSWNISEKLKQKLLEINPKIEFLVFDDF
jgi:SAM-dependent methyltransferase